MSVELTCISEEDLCQVISIFQNFSTRLCCGLEFLPHPFYMIKPYQSASSLLNHSTSSVFTSPISVTCVIQYRCAICNVLISPKKKANQFNSVNYCNSDKTEIVERLERNEMQRVIGQRPTSLHLYNTFVIYPLKLSDALPHSHTLAQNNHTTSHIPSLTWFHTCPRLHMRSSHTEICSLSSLFKLKKSKAGAASDIYD